MHVIPVSKRTVLSLLISSSFLAPAISLAADCPENTVCDTVIKTNGDTTYSGGDIFVSNGNGLEYQGGATPFSNLYLKNNIRVTGEGAHGIYIDAHSTFTGNVNIEGTSVVSENGTAIKIDGDFEQAKPINPNRGIYIKNGGLVSGSENAVDFSASSSFSISSSTESRSSSSSREVFLP